MSEDKRSPKILSLSWGRVEVAGADRRYKDAKLFPGGSRAWDWTETGTHHVPGVLPADLEELLERGAEEVVLSRGRSPSGSDPRTRPSERSSLCPSGSF